MPGMDLRMFRTRTVFVSDVHLGFRGCRSALFLDFLEHVDTERLVLVGDDFDGAVQFSSALRRFGSVAYDAMLHLGHAVHRVRGWLGWPHWSLATWVKEQVPDARDYVARFEHAAAHEALRLGLDGVICGHIHRPGVRQVDGILYCNDGDWVEHCTALVEDRSGRLALVPWTTPAAPVRSRGPGRLAALDPAA